MPRRSKAELLALTAEERALTADEQTLKDCNEMLSRPKLAVGLRLQCMKLRDDVSKRAQERADRQASIEADMKQSREHAAANRQVADLTEQVAALTKERDEARSVVDGLKSQIARLSARLLLAESQRLAASADDIARVKKELEQKHSEELSHVSQNCETRLTALRDELQSKHTSEIEQLKVQLQQQTETHTAELAAAKKYTGALEATAREFARHAPSEIVERVAAIRFLAGDRETLRTMVNDIQLRDWTIWKDEIAHLNVTGGTARVLLEIHRKHRSAEWNRFATVYLTQQDVNVEKELEALRTKDRWDRERAQQPEKKEWQRSV